MADETGHMDRPGAGPWSVNQAVGGVLTGYYTHPNSETGRVELVKGNPPGTPDTVVKEFSNTDAACLWLQTEWRAGRLR